MYNTNEVQLYLVNLKIIHSISSCARTVVILLTLMMVFTITINDDGVHKSIDISYSFDLQNFRFFAWFFLLQSETA